MQHTNADVIGLDWATDMATARATLGKGVAVQGNVDPMILFAPEEVRIMYSVSAHCCVRVHSVCCVRTRG